MTELREHGFTDHALDNFQRDFPDRKGAVWWYSKHSLFYGTLNQAFRQSNVRVLLLFGSFIQDLYRELASAILTQRATPRTTVYRGQLLPRNDLEKLLHGYTIRTSGFFSTSLKPGVASEFLEAAGENSQHLKRVVFEIEVDFQINSAVFADVSQLSVFSDEQEVLFMANTLFLFDSYREQSDSNGSSYWLVELKLQSDDDVYSNRDLHAGTGRRTVNNCVIALGDMLDMASLDEVTVVFDALMDIYPSEKNWIEARGLCCKAVVESQLHTNLKERDRQCLLALDHLKQAQVMWDNHPPNKELNSSFHVGEIHYAVAELYRDKMENRKTDCDAHMKQALHYYEQALNNCSPTDYERMGALQKSRDVSRNLAHLDLNLYGIKAVNYQKEWMKLIPQQEIANQNKILGDAYAVIHRYDDALCQYERAAKGLTHSNELYEQMVRISIEKQHDLALALHYQLLWHERKLKEFQENDALLERHLQVLAESHFSVADHYSGTQQYVGAHTHLSAGLDCCQRRREELRRTGPFVTTGTGPDVPGIYRFVDNRLQEFENSIEENEEKLGIVLSYLPFF